MSKIFKVTLILISLFSLSGCGRQLSRAEAIEKIGIDPKYSSINECKTLGNKVFFEISPIGFSSNFSSFDSNGKRIKDFSDWIGKEKIEKEHNFGVKCEKVFELYNLQGRLSDEDVINKYNVNYEDWN
ncbi:MAG: hypothetical protein ABIJ23_01835 [Candidatus Magasanikbacteria bacterium]